MDYLVSTKRHESCILHSPHTPEHYMLWYEYILVHNIWGVKGSVIHNLRSPWSNLWRLFLGLLERNLQGWLYALRDDLHTQAHYISNRIRKHLL